MSELTSCADLKSFIMSSDMHINHIIDGQVMENVRKQIEADIEDDCKIIAHFLRDGGRITESDDSRDYVEVSFGASSYREYDNGRILVTVSALSDDAKRVDDAVCAMLDLHKAEAVRDGGIEKMCRDAANYDYLLGMNSLAEGIRSEGACAAASIAVSRESDFTGGSR